MICWGRLTRITPNQHTRTTHVVGVASGWPRLGYPFSMTSSPLDPTQDFRQIDTTPIQEIFEDTGELVRFRTANTEYQWERLSTP